MRFISKARGFKKAVIKQKSTIINSDQGPISHITQYPYIALFDQGGATPYEKQLALDRFKFTGFSEKEDPTRFLSVYDTDEKARQEGWEADKKAEIERVLTDGQNEWYFLVEQPKAAKPWPSYDQTHESAVAETALTIGVDLGHVLAYERENQNRTPVIQAIENASVSDGVEISA